jgi:excisionase family DNA binding protein
MGSQEFRLLTVTEASDLLGLRKSRIYTLIRENILPAVHIGRQVRIDRNALHEWIQMGGRSLSGGWRRGEQITSDNEENLQ